MVKWIAHFLYHYFVRNLNNSGENFKINRVFDTYNLYNSQDENKVSTFTACINKGGGTYILV